MMVVGSGKVIGTVVGTGTKKKILEALTSKKNRISLERGL
jgi:hypothetical protein